jgi:hypothetical protein
MQIEIYCIEVAKRLQILAKLPGDAFKRVIGYIAAWPG